MNRYEFINKTTSTTGKRMYVPAIYPDIPPTNEDVYVITTREDKYTALAQQYYQDKTLWWIIPAANNFPCDTMYPPLGVQLRIPMNILEIRNSYKTVNSL